MSGLPLLGESLAVELANTIVGAGDDERDLLETDDDVVAWLAAHEDALPAGAVEHPPSLTAMHRIRDAIRALFEAVLDDHAPENEALASVNAASAAAPFRPVLDWAADAAPRVSDSSSASGPPTTIAAIARSAIELLGSDERERLRRCEGPGCVLVFVAASSRRRWCSSSSCGNRVRVARHYARTRAEDAPTTE